MVKMIEVENTSDTAQAISWIPAFEAWEKRKMVEPEANIVLWNGNFKATEAKKEKTDKKK